MTIRAILRKDSLPSGYSDTPFPDSRPQGQTKTQSNWRVKHDGSIEKVDGRTVIYDNSTGTVRGLFYPQKKTPLCTLTASNNTLYIKYNTTYYSATVQTGSYYTYATLATALQAAIIAAATASSGKVTVDHNSTEARKFTVAVSASGSTLILCWLHATTTIDKTLFGFYSSVSIAANNHAHSDFEVDNESVNAGIYAHESSTQLLKLFKSDGTQITYPPYGTPPTSLTYSNKDWAGTWSNGRAYLSSGVKNYIVRGKYVRRMPEYNLSNLLRKAVVGAASNSTLYSYTAGGTAANIISLGGAGNPTHALLKITAAAITYTVACDVVQITLSVDATTYGADLNIYYYVPSNGTKILIGTMRAEDLTTSPTLTTITTDVFCSHYAAQDYIWIEYVAANSDTGSQPVVYIRGANDATSNTYTATSDGIFAAVTTSKWYGVVKATPATATASFLCKFSLENLEGVETELGDYFNCTTTSGSSTCLYVGFSDYSDLTSMGYFDWEYVNTYRTADGATDATEDPFYIWARVPRATVLSYSSSGNFILWLGPITADEASDTARNLNLPYTISEWWEERQWIVGPDAPFIVYYSQAGEPENFDDSTTGNWISIGRDSMDITGLKAMGDRLVVYKANYLTSIIPSGSDYGVQEIASDGVGTLGQKSIVSVVGVDGQAQYFQGSDGHFYMTDGFRAIPLSKGQLDTYVEALNVTYLNKTSGFYNASKREIVWSVVTGANTSVDSNVVYSFITQRFHIETMPADFWATDNITTTGVTTYVGANTTKLFSYRTANTDLSAAIAATYETADLNMGMEDIPKDFHQLEITLRHETNPQSIVITWYTDYATSATGTSTIASTTTTTATKTKIPLNCRGKTIRFKIYNTDSSGYVQFNQLLIEYTPVKEINRGG